MRCNWKSTCGILDILTLAMMFSFFVCRATGQTLGAVCPGWSVTNDVRMAIDLNRDGKADLAAFDNPDNFNHSALWTSTAITSPISSYSETRASGLRSLSKTLESRGCLQPSLPMV
jgi:hypothetical protein